MRKHFTLLLLIFFVSVGLFATHQRTGEIQYQRLGSLTYRAIIVSYTKTSSAAADRDSLELHWGDGTSTYLLRINGIDTDGDGIPDGEILDNDIKKNLYAAIHTYAAPSDYTLSYIDFNRIADIINVANPSQSNQPGVSGSVNVPFSVETRLRFLDFQAFGFNNSPILLQLPFDDAFVNQRFIHNPAAFDPDGDSLAYELTTPKSMPGTDVPDYFFPNEVEPGPDNNFSIDPITGDLVWETPQKSGIYNVAFRVNEYRRGVLIGSVVRDMQIFVFEGIDNNFPQLEEQVDRCVIAGETLEFTVNATDADGDPITLSAQGGPFEVSNSPATFTAPQAQNPISGTFLWNTNCAHIQNGRYNVVFKAEHNILFNDSIITIADLKTMFITVLAPPPEGLIADAIGNDVFLNWTDPYSCDQANFRGFSVWRSDNCGTTFGCTNQLAPLYTQIGETTNYNFEDFDVERGIEYSYRVQAMFADTNSLGQDINIFAGVPSEEACVIFKKDIPVLLNVDVLSTDSNNGEIFIQWAKPVSDNENLDTIQFQGPYRFDLSRAVGINGTNFQVISQGQETAFFGSLIDTIFTDISLDTETLGYNYKVSFYAMNNELVGESPISSSVFLDMTPEDGSINLSWDFNVSWLNNSYKIFREDTPGNFIEIANTTSSTYLDTGLENGIEYCYMIETSGEYSDPVYERPLINKSQIKCAVPRDTIPPCSPTSAEISNFCNTEFGGKEPVFSNVISWSYPNDPCNIDIEGYYIYFSPTTDGDLVLIDSTSVLTDTTYVHELNNGSIAGCYVVTAFDEFRNESSLGGRSCVDNCPLYELPNVFTPNNDGQNDEYTPFLPFRFVERIDIKIFNNWGNLVFETTDPFIRWEGKDQKFRK